MVFYEQPGSPIDPFIHRLMAQRNRRVEEAPSGSHGEAELEAPSPQRPLRLTTRLRRYPSQIELSDISTDHAPIDDQAATTPMGRWLPRVEAGPPGSRESSRPVSHWSSDSDPSSDSTGL
ncbi:hypothetical protein VP01_947g1 [Puccinia sorghi]|uniref:Uncharacterized protein n=1 Tax=Puccinia sorghi TaxID=27349 RepID=A0A0L6U6H6_9BASI|nr:hypothetical protein VP01_947g1 [Puccinia sorghi]